MKKRTTFVRDNITVVLEDSVLNAEIPIGDGVKRFYHPNRALSHEVPVVAGENHGMARSWHDDGKLAEETRWECGKIQGVIRCWDRDGSLSHQLEYVLPNAIYGTVYADGGRIHHAFLWNGKPISKARWLKRVEAAGIARAELEHKFGPAKK